MLPVCQNPKWIYRDHPPILASEEPEKDTLPLLSQLSIIFLLNTVGKSVLHGWGHGNERSQILPEKVHVHFLEQKLYMYFWVGQTIIWRNAKKSLYCSLYISFTLYECHLLDFFSFWEVQGLYIFGNCDIVWQLSSIKAHYLSIFVAAASYRTLRKWFKIYFLKIK